jgi:type II secretory pathway component GspD/PulD (secretin)
MKSFLFALLVTVCALGAQTSVGSAPSEFVSEVVPTKYAQAGDVAATRQDMQRMKKTIFQLDIAAVQVLIEAVILQVTASGSNNLGMIYFAGETQKPADSSFDAGALSRSNLLSITRFAPIAGTHTLANQPSGFEYLAKPGTDLDVMVPALAADSRIRILQRPRILASIPNAGGVVCAA